MQRLVVWGTLSYILSTASITWNDSRFWCVLVLVWILEHLSNIEGGIQSADHLMNMSRSQLLELKDFIDRVSKGDDAVSEEELNKILKKKEDCDADK